MNLPKIIFGFNRNSGQEMKVTRNYLVFLERLIFINCIIQCDQIHGMETLILLDSL